MAIGYGAFYDCSSLQHVVLPEGLTFEDVEAHVEDGFELDVVGPGAELEEHLQVADGEKDSLLHQLRLGLRLVFLLVII